MTTNLQDCTTIEPLLDAYHDDELSGDEKSSVEAHLKECDACSKQLQQIGKLVAVLKSMPATTSKIDFADRFVLPASTPVTAVVSDDSKKVVPGKFGWIGAVGAIAASVALFAVVGQYAMHRGAGNSVANVTSSNARQLTASSTQRPEGNQVNRALQSERLASIKSEDEGSETEAAGDVAKTPVSESTKTHNASTDKPAVRVKAPRVEVASVTGSQGRSNDVVASAYSSSKATATGSNNEGIQSSDGSKHSLVAFYASDPNTIPEELGISTDEDGLYAIKM